MLPAKQEHNVSRNSWASYQIKYILCIYARERKKERARDRIWNCAGEYRGKWASESYIDKISNYALIGRKLSSRGIISILSLRRLGMETVESKRHYASDHSASLNMNSLANPCQFFPHNLNPLLSFHVFLNEILSYPNLDYCSSLVRLHSA